MYRSESLFVWCCFLYILMCNCDDVCFCNSGWKLGIRMLQTIIKQIASTRTRTRTQTAPLCKKKDGKYRNIYFKCREGAHECRQSCSAPTDRMADAAQQRLQSCNREVNFNVIAPNPKQHWE